MNDRIEFLVTLHISADRPQDCESDSDAICQIIDSAVPDSSCFHLEGFIDSTVITYSDPQHRNYENVVVAGLKHANDIKKDFCDDRSYYREKKLCNAIPFFKKIWPLFDDDDGL